MTNNIKRITYLLSLTNVSNVQIDHIEKLQHRFIIMVKWKDEITLTLEIEPVNLQKAAFFRSPFLNISYQGKTLTPSQEKLFNHLLPRLVTLKFSDLDANYKVPVQDERHRIHLAQRKKQIDYPNAWGHSPLWARFVSDKVRSIGEGLRLEHNILDLSHQDKECDGIYPRFLGTNLRFLRFPWHRETTEPKPTHTSVSKEQPHHRFVHLDTDMREIDVIMGGNRKLQELMKHAACRAGHDLCLLHFTCVPSVIGDNVDAAKQLFCDKCDTPLLYVQDDRDFGDSPWIVLLEKEMQRYSFTPPKAPTNRLNFIGYSETPEMQELLSILQKIGIQANLFLLPRLNLRDFERIMNADAQVYIDNYLWQRFYDRIFSRLPLKTLTPPAPYGIEQTREWLLQIATFFGKQEKMCSLWDQHYTDIAAKWSLLKDKTSKHRLAIIMEKEYLSRLTDSRQCSSIPMMYLLTEMGFRIDVCIRCPKDADAKARLASKIKAEFKSYNCRIRWFSTQDELQSILAEEEISCVYSDIFFDKRLTSNGKTGFSFHAFRMGLIGTMRNIEHLLSLCEARFYRTYSRYLSY